MRRRETCCPSGGVPLPPRGLASCIQRLTLLPEAFSCLRGSLLSHIIINGSAPSEGFQRPELPRAPESCVEEEFYQRALHLEFYNGAFRQKKLK